MKGKELARKLIVQAPPDLLVDIYGKTRWFKEASDHERGWRLIVDQARMLGIFTAHEGERFLQFVADHFPRIVDTKGYELEKTTETFTTPRQMDDTDHGGARWTEGQDYSPEESKRKDSRFAPNCAC